MARLVFWVNKAHQLALWTATVVLVSLATLTFLDVLGRYWFLSPVPGTVELTEILMALFIFGALAVATYSGEHVKVELLLDRISPLWNDVFRKLGEIAVFLVAVAMAWAHFEHAGHLMTTGDLTPVLRLPLYPYSYLVFGLSILIALIAGHIVLGRTKDAGNNAESAT